MAVLKESIIASIDLSRSGTLANPSFFQIPKEAKALAVMLRLEARCGTLMVRIASGDSPECLELCASALSRCAIQHFTIFPRAFVQKFIYKSGITMAKNITL
jgi:hypothetical protein